MMLADFEEIYVVCPAQVVTGGPEALHQLVDALRSVAKRAFISYYPEGERHQTNSHYQIYDVEQAEPRDIATALVILPEVETDRAATFLKASRAIWWLSVDNYVMKCNAFGNKLAIPTHVRHCHHMWQSQYAASFLASHGMSGRPLCGYIATNFLLTEDEIRRLQKEDIIAFNPKKGFDLTRELMRLDIPGRWVPIENLSRAGVRDLLRRAKLYVDFGDHPGKDRIPREAAISGACVITGRRGSAAFSQDVPIPVEWKLDEIAPDFKRRFEELACKILRNHASHVDRLKQYRSTIRSEKQAFFAAVNDQFLAKPLTDNVGTVARTLRRWFLRSR
jgi:hypothetical protein